MNINKNKKMRLALKFSVLLLISAFLVNLTQLPKVKADIEIISPSQGQTFSGNDVEMSGMTDPNATVLILKGEKVLKQIITDNDGKWSVKVTNLPDGNNTLTAKVVKNKGYAYYSALLQDNSFELGQVKLADNTINSQVGWPKAINNISIAFTPSPTQNIYYGFATSLSVATPPTKFDADNPASPIPVANYPSNPQANKGDFSGDGLKYYSPNLSLNSISLVNTQTNAWVEDINLGSAPIFVARGPNNKLYVSVDKGIKTINTNNNTVTSAIDNLCAADIAGIGFSDDPTYEYYYVPCRSEGTIKKIRISDNSIAETYTIGGTPTGMVLSADNSKLYVYATAIIPGTQDSDKIRVVSTETGTVTNTVQLQSGILGALNSADYQKLYLATPGASLDQSNIDVVNLNDLTVEHISMGGKIVAAVSSSPSTTADIKEVNVGVVLGVKTAASTTDSTAKLAETGVIAISSTILFGLIIAFSSYLYWDYRRHKKPLVAADPSSKSTYTFAHHIKTVTIPLMRYRIKFSLAKESNSDYITKF